MSTAVVRSKQMTPRAAADGGGTAWRFWSALGGVLLAVGLIVAWFLGWISLGTDPRVAEIRQLQAETGGQFAETGPRTLAEATAAVTAMNTIRAKVEALPPHLRPQVEQQGRNTFRTAMRKRIDAYFTAPPEQRQAELDRQIDQEEMMRMAFEAGRAVTSMMGGGQQAGPSGGGGSGQQQAGQGVGQQQAGPPAGGPTRSGSEEDRNRWRKTMIDSTTPEQRARYVEYRRAMEKRREQRGLQSPGWGR